MNTKEIFTDFPRKKAVIKRTLIDMWKNFADDTEEDVKEMWLNDSNSKYYDPSKMIKGQD